MLYSFSIMSNSKYISYSNSKCLHAKNCSTCILAAPSNSSYLYCPMR